MSRIGKLPISLPEGAQVSVENELITVKGKLGTLEMKKMPQVMIRQEEKTIVVERNDNTQKSRAVHGLTRALLNNLIVGVSEGFTRELEITGVGYNVKLFQNSLIITVGFSHSIFFRMPQGITAEVPDPTRIVIKGIDKHLVGQVSANIRRIRPPEPYKGKGIRFKGEVIRRKAGKTAGK